nr:hypothetical protein Iba_chr14eCG5080 [Ipomoea batatas]
MTGEELLEGGSHSRRKVTQVDLMPSSPIYSRRMLMPPLAAQRRCSLYMKVKETKNLLCVRSVTLPERNVMMNEEQGRVRVEAQGVHIGMEDGVNIRVGVGVNVGVRVGVEDEVQVSNGLQNEITCIHTLSLDVPSPILIHVASLSTTQEGGFVASMEKSYTTQILTLLMAYQKQEEELIICYKVDLENTRK